MVSFTRVTSATSPGEECSTSSIDSKSEFLHLPYYEPSLMSRDRLIKVNGNQVAPADLEGHLLAHPDVLNCAVIGVPDDRAGERPKGTSLLSSSCAHLISPVAAYVVLSIAANARVAKGESSLEQVAEGLKKHVADHKISYKHLHYVEFIDAIPMTASGESHPCPSSRWNGTDRVGR